MEWTFELLAFSSSFVFISFSNSINNVRLSSVKAVQFNLAHTELYENCESSHEWCNVHGSCFDRVMKIRTKELNTECLFLCEFNSILFFVFGGREDEKEILIKWCFIQLSYFVKRLGLPHMLVVLFFQSHYYSDVCFLFLQTFCELLRLVSCCRCHCHCFQFAIRFMPVNNCKKFRF